MKDGWNLAISVAIIGLVGVEAPGDHAFRNEKAFWVGCDVGIREAKVLANQGFREAECDGVVTVTETHRAGATVTIKSGETTSHEIVVDAPCTGSQILAPAEFGKTRKNIVLKEASL